MKTVCIASGKGGTGKSTLTKSVAAAAAVHETAKVVVIDADVKQQSLVFWSKRRTMPWPKVVAAGPADIDQLLGRYRRYGCDYMFIDTPGYDDASVALIIALSDFVLIPCRPSVLDQEGIKPTIAICRRLDAKYAIIASQVGPRSEARVAEVREQNRLTGGVVLDAQLSSRVAYQDATRRGLTVDQCTADPVLALEPLRIWNALKSRLGIVSTPVCAAAAL